MRVRKHLATGRSGCPTRAGSGRFPTCIRAIGTHHLGTTPLPCDRAERCRPRPELQQSPEISKEAEGAATKGNRTRGGRAAGQRSIRSNMSDSWIFVEGVLTHLPVR